MGTRRGLVLACALAVAQPAWPQSPDRAEGSASNVEPSVTPSVTAVLAEVNVNGRATGVQDMKRDVHGIFLASTEQLRRWGVAPVPSKALTDAGLLPLIPPIDAHWDEQRQTLALDFPGDMLVAQTVDATIARHEDTVQVIPSVLLNYALQARQVDGRTQGSALVDGGLDVAGGLATSQFALNSDPGGPHLIRLETSWTIDDPTTLRRTVLGDAVTFPGQSGQAVRFAGLRWGTDFSLRPDLITFPLPALSGTAALPSTVDVLVNGATVASQHVNPGPFDVTSLPIISGQGDVSLRVTDALGRQQTITRPFYASTSLLRPGLSQSSLAVGVLRSDFLLRSDAYRTPFGQALYRLGLDDLTTIEGRGELSVRHVTTAVGVTRQLAQLAVVQAGAAVSSRWADAPEGTTRSGASASIGLEHQGALWRANASLRYDSPGFVQLGDPRLDPVGSLPAVRARRTTQVYGGLLLGSQSIGLAYIDRSDEYGDDRLPMLNYAIRLAGSATLGAYAGHDSRTGRMLGLTLVIPVGERAVASISNQRNGPSVRDDVQFQWTPPAGPGYGFTVRASSADPRVAASVIRQDYATQAIVDVAQDGRETALRAYVAGGLIATRDHLSATRDTSQSTAIVSVGRQPGVRVFLENRLAGVTDTRGQAWVSGLKPYQPNHLSIDPDDLPLDVLIDSSDLSVRPPGRSVIGARFAVSSQPALRIRLLIAAGTPLPPQAIVQRADGRQVPSGQDGEVYLRTFTPGEVLTAQWRDGACSARIPADDAHRAQGRGVADGWLSLACLPPAPARPPDRTAGLQ